jgi:hypothetical protein
MVAVEKVQTEALIIVREAEKKAKLELRNKKRKRR